MSTAPASAGSQTEMFKRPSRSSGSGLGHRRSHRQLDREDAALAGHVHDPNLAAVRVDALAADGKTKPEAGLVGAAPIERTEQPLRLARRQTAALVFDLDEDSISLLERAHRD